MQSFSIKVDALTAGTTWMNVYKLHFVLLAHQKKLMCVKKYLVKRLAFKKNKPVSLLELNGRHYNCLLCMAVVFCGMFVIVMSILSSSLTSR